MINKYCILIDERDQRGSLESIKRKLRTSHGIDLIYTQLNPSDAKYQSIKDESEKPFFDETKFTQALSEIEFFRRCNSIAIDYNLIHNKLNGFEVALMIRKLGYKINKDILLYSAGIEKAVESILNLKEFNIMRRNLSRLLDSNISFHKNDNFEDKIIDHIRQEPKFSFDKELTDWLHKFPDKKFIATYPPYKDLLFNDIAQEIEVDTHLSQEFKKHLIEYLFSILIEINDLE